MRLKLTAATHQTDCNRSLPDGAGRRPYGDVVAICLEHDVVMQGHDQNDAILALEAGISLMWQDAVERGVDPIAALGAPPPVDEVARFTGPRVSFEVDTDEWLRQCA